ncbi:hypothetical protein D8674_040472 [Pyrus ussuriensis x Pyrus communis]|uniref:HMA domain-containing protein n=1 Tax=Pyrus ussuriensis x Pyrus communis TaxID=2448454 RepID=A0A5N5G2S7_9ROSA|nr:hypothetical protein D8674_040472 [Pyrus ussuriensis x Pyrus communis]
MKQTITIEAQFRCAKCRSKAMEIAVAEDGVTSVAFKGANRDQLVITGDGVDAAGLAKSLRKKLGHADLLSVEEKKTFCRHPHQLEFYINKPPRTSACTIL